MRDASNSLSVLEAVQLIKLVVEASGNYAYLSEYKSLVDHFIATKNSPDVYLATNVRMNAAKRFWDSCVPKDSNGDPKC